VNAFRAGPAALRHVPREEINLVPFIDVLLVLLVIFIVAAPVLTHAVHVDLPRAASAPEQGAGRDLELSVMADGTLLADGAIVSEEELGRRLFAAARDPRAGVRLQADARVPYQAVARTLALSARAGMSRIRFVSLPPPGR
jgi:biopolymer transport protein ExbD